MTGPAKNIPTANPCVYTSTGPFYRFTPMSSSKMKSIVRGQIGRFLALAVVASLALTGTCLSAIAQDTSAAAQSSSQDNGKPKQDVPAEAGGPTDNVGPYAIPKKKAEDPPPPTPPPAPKKAEDLPDYSLKVNVPLVNVEVMVTTKDGQFIPGLKQENFRVAEDGVPQQLKHFGVSRAPITAVLLVEFASTNYF